MSKIGLTTTYKKIKAIKQPWRLLQGGQGAGKNFAMALILMERQDARIITIMTDTYQNLKDGPIADFKKICELNNIEFYKYYNRSEKVLTWGNSSIQFRHLDDNKPDKGKGPRRDILYINEGNRVGWEAVKHYIARSREIYVDFNPDFEFWAHKELLPKDKCKRIIVTYKDNEKCPQNEVEYIESRKHLTEWFKVYGLGQTGTYSERRIYKFEIVDEVPVTARMLPRGMDFGHSPDPTAMVDIYEDGVNLYIDEVFCETNLLPEEVAGAIDKLCIADRMDQEALKYARKQLKDVIFTEEDTYYLRFNTVTDKVKRPEDQRILDEIYKYRSRLILADSSGAKSIADIKKRGYKIRGVKKVKGSVLDGIGRLQSYNIKVTRRSINVKQGMESWLRKLDKNGEITSEPLGHEPDTLAAARYVMLGKALWGNT